MFTKSTLKHVLPAALLVASASAFAQTSTGTVTIADGKTTKTWEEIVTALKNTDLDALNQAVTNAQNTLSTFDANSQMETASWLTDQQEAADKFQTAYNVYYQSKTDNTTDKIWAKSVSTIEDLDLTVSFVDVSGNGWKAYTAGEFYNAFTSKKAATTEATDEEPTTMVGTLNIYFGEDYKTNNGVYAVASYTQAQQRNIVTIVVDLLNNTLPSNKAFQVENKDYATAKKALTDAVNALNTAQTTLEDYSTITLTSDIVVDNSPIASFSGIIYGDNHTITATNGAVFTKFTGELSGAAVNGTFATSSKGASFDNVALWNKVGTLYNASGVSTEYNTIGELGFAARNLFGVANGNLATKAADNTVYSITVYTTANSSTPSYATYNNGKYTDVDAKAEITVGDNVFVKSATKDLVELGATNVFYNGKAKTVVITDREDFFCPEDINAETVTYDRTFGTYTALCLPFEISSKNFTGTAEVGEYEKADTDKFWFTIQGSSVAAYTPVLVKGATGFAALENINIKKTETQVVDGGNGSYGTVKNTNIQEFLGASQAERVYVLSGDGFKYGTSENGKTEVPAFRMVVTLTPEAGLMTKAPRGIGFIGENGESAIEEVSADVEALEVVGGQGVITIHSAADCGNVEVVSMDGKVVATANVVAGATTVNVQKGLYIVMGQKVLVK